jgi:hypothetical protein
MQCIAHREGMVVGSDLVEQGSRGRGEPESNFEVVARALVVFVVYLVTETAVLLLVTVIRKSFARTIIAGKPIDFRNILNTGKAAVDLPSTQCANIPEMGLRILMKAGGQAAEAQVGWEVTNVKLVMIRVDLGLKGGDSVCEF